MIIREQELKTTNTNDVRKTNKTTTFNCIVLYYFAILHPSFPPPFTLPNIHNLNYKILTTITFTVERGQRAGRPIGDGRLQTSGTGGQRRERRNCQGPRLSTAERNQHLPGT